MSLRSTIRAFDEWRWAGQSIVLVTVIETEGSTYTKAGHRMVVAENGDYHGLVSGGCLEGDLALHAREVLGSGSPKRLSYDLRDEAEDPFGLGVGCNGVLRLLLQRLDPATHYAPFLEMADCHRSFHGGRARVITESTDPALPVGAALVETQDGALGAGLDAAAVSGLVQALQAQAGAGLVELALAGGRLAVLSAPLQPIPRLLVIGAGPDAVPLVRMAAELGWQVTLTDHRPAYLATPELQVADSQCEARPGELGRQLALNEFHAAVLMTHHLESDRAHLAELSQSAPDYLGLLGPRARATRLLSDLKLLDSEFAAQLHAPVGLDLRADSPEGIALSILAEIQTHLAGLPAPLDS